MEISDIDEPFTWNEYKKIKMISMNSVDINHSCVFKKPYTPDPQDIDTDSSTNLSTVQENSVTWNKSRATPSLPPVNIMSFWQEKHGMNCDQDISQFKNLENPIIITCWSPLLLINNKLAFVGISLSNRVVKFTNIQKRLSRSKMSDINGIVYMLCGPMYPKKDLPQFIKTKFTSGIPENWEELCSLWGYYLDLDCPKDFCWSNTNTSVVTEAAFIEKKPRGMTPLPLNDSLNSINPNNTNSCSMVNASTALKSSTRSYTIVMLKKKIAKLQAILHTAMLHESMHSQHLDDTVINNTVAEIREHRNNGSQHSNPLQHKNNEQYGDSDTGATLILQKDFQKEPNDNVSTDHIISKNIDQNQPVLIDLGHGDNLPTLPDPSVDIQQTPAEHARFLKKTNKKNIQVPITSVRCSTQLKTKRKVFTKNTTAKKNTSSKTSQKSTTTTQVNLYQWRPVFSFEGNSCIMGIQGYEQQNMKMRHYMTDEICKRISNYRVVDKAGVEYNLMGKLTDPHNELPDSVKSRFKRGINQLWRNVLSDYSELMGNCTSFDSQNMPISASHDLTVSKRGRRIIPRLNYWLGERISIRTGKTLIDSRAVQVVDEHRIQKGRNAGKSMSLLSSSTAITPQVRLIPLDKSFIHKFPSEDRLIVMRFLKKTPGTQLMGSQTTAVEFVGTTSHRANNTRAPKINAASTSKEVTFGSSLKKNDKENKDKTNNGGVLAGKVMKPKQRIRKQQLKVGNEFLHEMCSLLKPKDLPKSKIKSPSVQTSSQTAVVSDSNKSIFQNVLNGSYIPKKRKLFSMNNMDYQINDGDQATSSVSAPGAPCSVAVPGTPRFTVTWNDTQSISGRHDNLSEVSALK